MILVWVLIVVLDLLALQMVLAPPHELIQLVGLVWFLLTNYVVGWLGGMRALKRLNTGNALQALERLAVVFLIMVVLGRVLRGHDQEWLIFMLLLNLQVGRLGPLVSLSILASPVLWLMGGNKGTGGRRLLVIQACAWLAAVLLVGQTDPPLQLYHFLFWSLWAPNWGHGLLTAGVLLQLNLRRPLPALDAAQPPA